MSRFMRITGWTLKFDHGQRWPWNLEHQVPPATSWIDRSLIGEICTGPQMYARDEQGAPIYETVDGERVYELAPTTALKVVVPHSTGADYLLDIGGWVVEGDPEDWVALVEPPEPEPQAHRVNERGEWVPDEDYVPLDYATKPGTTDGYLCVAPNKSSSAGVLANTKFWCRVDLPEEE